MKRLLLIRHAKSSWSDPSVSDFDRKLNRRGKADAPFMAAKLAERGVNVDMILASPAKRAARTAIIVARAVGFKKSRITYEQDIYFAGREDLVRIIRGLDDACESLLLVGHNFAITDLAEDLLADELGNIPTSGMVALDCNVNSWREIDSGCAGLLFFDYPKRYTERR